MLTKEQNKRFTEVGPGTPMGELLRRYWMPFATVKQLEEHPTRAITLLGEHLRTHRECPEERRDRRRARGGCAGAPGAERPRERGHAPREREARVPATPGARLPGSTRRYVDSRGLTTRRRGLGRAVRAWGFLR